MATHPNIGTETPDADAGRESAMAAVSRFIDTVTPVVGDYSSRKAVVDAALVLAQELMAAQEFLRRVPQRNR